MTRFFSLVMQSAAAAGAAAMLLAAPPAMAQHSVSGTIGGKQAASASAAAAATAPTPPPAAAASAAAPVSAGAAAGTAAETAGAPTSAASATAAGTAAATATAPAPVANNGMVTPSPRPVLDVAAPPPPASTGSLLQTTLALMFVLALLVGLAWMLKRFGPKTFGGGSKTVRLVGALSVGARERILVVEVGEQWIVVGASPGRMNALATMPRQEIDEAQAASAGGLPGAPNFAEWFKQTIEKRNGK